jgi:glutamine cyclotransferase
VLNGAAPGRSAGLIVFLAGLLATAGPLDRAEADSIPTYGYELHATHPHDPDAFTQGLVYVDGFFYEGTGLYGASSIRKVVPETGEVLKIRRLGSSFFGEGVTVYADTIYQLTWLEHTGFVFVELDTFHLVETFGYDTNGWGLTHDDTSLIMSNGTSVLRHLDPETYEVVGQVTVTADGIPVDLINEMEMVRGNIYANILNSDSIAVINPGTGEVTAWLDFSGILADPPGPLNGIAFDAEAVRLYVTGKRWPSVFEVYADPLDYPPRIVDVSPVSPAWVHADSVLPLSVSVVDSGPADSLCYCWSIDGTVDPAGLDSVYAYSSAVPTTDTVEVTVSDGVFEDSASWIIYVEIAGVEGDLDPRSLLVCQNRPNPFRPVTEILFTVPGGKTRGSRVRLTVHDVGGRELRRLVDRRMSGGEHRVNWDGTDARGRRVSPGVYFYTADVGEKRVCRKMVVLDE